LRRVLSWRVGLDLGAARERVRVAHALGALPLMAQHSRAASCRTPRSERLPAGHTETEERLLVVGRQGTAAHVERIVRGWRQVDRHAEAREAARRHAVRALHVYQDEDGTSSSRPTRAGGRRRGHEGAGGGTGDSVSEIVADVRGCQRGRFSETPTMAQQQADALALLAETALHHELDPAPRAIATRSWSTSKLRRWPIRISRASRPWRTACAFPRKRLAVWRVMPAGW